MAGKPRNFQAISNVLPTYNFVDIIAGTGYVNFYAGNTVDIYSLSNFTFYSETVSTATGAMPGPSAATKLLDIDFDVVLNRPLDIKGLGIVNVPIALQNAHVDASGYGYVIVTLRRVTGGVESDIVTNTSSAFYSTAGSVTTYKMFSLDLNITSVNHYKIGDTLRLTVEFWGEMNHAGGTLYGFLGNDPLNRSAGWDSSGAVPSRLSFQCPVRLNL